MNLRTRSVLTLTALTLLLAACGSTVTATPQPSAPQSPAPTEPEATPSAAPTESPAETPEIAGTLTMVDGVSAGGPGASIADALAHGMTEPMLINGVLFKDLSGTIYLASSMTDADAPTFGGPMLEVIGYPEATSDWDMASADVTGLMEANGILYFETAQLFGVVEA